jgi:hypothetical protein
VAVSLWPAASATILKDEVLRTLLRSTGRTVATAFRVAVCVVSVAMLLSFPTARASRFGQNFGTTEIRQNIVRHTFVAGPETGGIEKIAHIDELPVIPTLVTVEQVAKSFFRLPILSGVPTFRVLQHLRLRLARSGSTDPLI